MSHFDARNVGACLQHTTSVTQPIDAYHSGARRHFWSALIGLTLLGGAVGAGVDMPAASAAAGSTTVHAIDVEAGPALDQVGPTMDISGYYVPAGFEGDIDGIVADVANTDPPLAPGAPSSIAFQYAPGSLGWGGVAFLITDATFPQGNWGGEQGLNLTGARRVVWQARGQQGGERVQFLSGGIQDPNLPYKDTYKVSKNVVLTTDWTQYSLDIPQDRDLSGVLSPLTWVATRAQNPNGFTFYLANIVIEGLDAPQARTSTQPL